MSATPTPSPWPAPTLVVAARGDIDSTTTLARQKPVARALDAIRRLTDPGLRAEHAAVKDEQRIDNELGGLPCAWFVLPLADVDVIDAAGGPDHLVIGPGGVFIIRLQHQPAARVWVSERTMTIDGRTSNCLDQARGEARRASDRLTAACGFDVTVQSILVMIGATVHSAGQPAEVHVRAQHDLPGWLCLQPGRLDVETVVAINQRVGRRRPGIAL